MFGNQINKQKKKNNVTKVGGRAPKEHRAVATLQGKLLLLLFVLPTLQCLYSYFFPEE